MRENDLIDVGFNASNHKRFRFVQNFDKSINIIVTDLKASPTNSLPIASLHMEKSDINTFVKSLTSLIELNKGIS